MKNILIILSIFNFISCSNYAQQNSGKLIIDKKLTNRFFENTIIVGQEGSDKYYTDSVLVYSNDSVITREVLVNADIRDSNGKHYSFFSCKSFFVEDTLVVEFKSGMKLSNSSLKIKVVSKKFYAYFFSGDGSIENEYEAVPISLKFRKKINRKGQKIFGELEIEFRDPETKLDHIFKGPFFCIVE